MFVNILRNRLKTFSILVIIKTKTNEKTMDYHSDQHTFLLL